MTRDDVDVVILAHQAGALLLAAVGSALDEVGIAHVIVVDAASTDGSVAEAEARFPGLRVIAAENRGFSFGNNLGIAAAHAPFVLLLNPDAELLPGAVGALVSRAEADATIAVVGAKILNPDGSLQANAFGRFPSLAQVLSLRFTRAVERLAGNRRHSPRDFDAPKRVDWVTGACMLVRRVAIEQVGPLDDGFFLYYEDVDWCHRMRDAGWEVVVEPAARCIHHLGQTGGDSAIVREAYRASFMRYCRKYRLRGLLLLGSLGAAARKAAGGRA